VSAALDAWLAAVRAGAARAQAGAFAHHVSVRATTGSTNDEVARAAVEGAPEGYTVIAAEQTAGRGRRGASWHSPAAHGLYVSTLLRPDRWSALAGEQGAAASSLVTLMAGVAVAEAVREACGAAVELKWPNDVMVRSRRQSAVDTRQAGLPSAQPGWRKLAGILAEGASDGGVLRTVVVGVGINVLRSDAPPDVAARMITLEDLAPASCEPLALVSAVVAALLERMHTGVGALAAGDLVRVRESWLALAPSVDGTPVRWHHHGVTHSGRARGIDQSGALRVQVAAAAEMLVHGGEVEWLLEGVGA
jgi:BirA family biotin operon repressor/biotin-[acetyl-CoA-carboxylase] ligase